VDSIFNAAYLTFVTNRNKISDNTFAILGPLSLATWIWVILAFPTVICVAVFMTWLQKRYKNIWNPNQIPTYSIGEFIVACGATFLQQPVLLPQCFKFKLLLVCWGFYSLIITTAYRSKLVSELVSPTVETGPSTFKDLVESNYKIGFIRQGQAAYNTLASGDDPVYKVLIQKAKVFTGTGVDCIEMVMRKDDWACVAYDYAIQHAVAANLSQNDVNKLAFPSARTYNVFTSVTLPKNSLLKEYFN